MQTGDLGSIFSSPATSTSPCLLHYKPYISWTTPHAWTYALPDGEAAVALAITAPPSTAHLSSALGDDADASGTIVVGTSNGYLRFLTGSGIQKYLWQLGGEIVAMASGKELLIVLHREFSEGGGNKRGLEYTLLDLESFEVLQVGKIPITAEGATISWVGFTEDDVSFTVIMSVPVRPTWCRVASELDCQLTGNSTGTDPVHLQL